MKKVFLAVTCVILISILLSISYGCSPEKPNPSLGMTPTSPATAPAKQMVWKLATFAPSGDDRYKIYLSFFKDQVNYATKGQIKIETYPMDSLVPNAELPAAVAEGAVQMAQTVGTFWAPKMPVGSVEYWMPLASQSFQDTWTLMWDKGLQDVLRKAYAEQGAYLLGFELGTGACLMTKEPIRSVSDLKGKKIRATGTLGHFMTKLGASAVNLPMGEIYMALKLGTIDGAILGYEQHYALKHQEICKYLLMNPSITRADPIDLLVNLKTWDALSDDLKITLDYVCRYYSVWCTLIGTASYNRKATAEFRAAGVEFVQFSEAELQNMQNIAIDVWNELEARDKYCKEGVTIVKNYFRELGRIK